jgi:hypothetical protein
LDFAINADDVSGPLEMPEEELDIGGTIKENEDKNHDGPWKEWLNVNGQPELSSVSH